MQAPILLTKDVRYICYSFHKMRTRVCNISTPPRVSESKFTPRVAEKTRIIKRGIMIELYDRKQPQKMMVKWLTLIPQ